MPGWSLKVRLARGTRLQSVSGAAASARRGAITLRPRGTRTTMTVVIKGARIPSGWKVGKEPCTARNLLRRGTQERVAVSCDLPEPPPTQVSGGTKPGGTAPTGTPLSSGGGSGPAGNANTPGGVVTPGPNTNPSGGTPTPPAPYRFAPYVDFAGWPTPDLADIRAGSGADHISLGFVVQSSAGGCVPTWGGYTTYPAAGVTAYERAQVLALRAAGGDIVVSFGGAAGTELALACASASQLAAAYQSVIDAYGATHVDVDVEGAALLDSTGNTRRAQAVAKLQQTNPNLVVTYTLPTETTGLAASGLAAVQNAVDHGVKLAAVNLMTMDYAAPGDPAGQMGAWAISAATGLHAQLAPLFPNLPAAERWRLVGVTPMIGINDYDDQVFSLADAQAVTSWARTNQIGMLAMWSLERDSQCPDPVTTKQLTCSGVAQAPFAFAKAFAMFNS